jgi:hypothetical protein
MVTRSRPRDEQTDDLARTGSEAPLRGRRIAEALKVGTDVADAAADFGATLALAGEGLDVCLRELDTAYLVSTGGAADPRVARRAALAWAATVQQRFNNLACADPATGLGSIQHVRAQVVALYQAARDGWLATDDIARTHALVVVEMSSVREDVRPSFAALEGAMRRARAGQLIRHWLPESIEASELNPRRLVTVARHSDDLDARLAGLADAIDRRLKLAPSGGSCRAWSETLPSGVERAMRLLDQLAR